MMSHTPERFAAYQCIIWDSYKDSTKPKKGTAVQYAHRLSAGMKAKKYKGGVAAKAKASSNRLFEQYFKPLI